MPDLYSYLGDHLCCLPKVRTSSHGIRFRQVVLDQPQANVVAHLIQLLVDFGVVAVEIFAQLCDDCAVRQDDELRVDLVYPRPSEGQRR